MKIVANYLYIFDTINVFNAIDEYKNIAKEYILIDVFNS